jgi:phosphoribosylanthranilate isomerase
MSDVAVKICGLTSPEDVIAAAHAGARYVGFVFFPKSPRNVSIQQAATLAAEVPFGVAKVALTVNADDALLDQITQNVAIDILQLHGSESVERVAQIKARTGLPVMKAIGISDAEDLQKIVDYGRVADMLLVDAKPPKNADLPGGNGLAFDWRLLAGRKWAVPWMLAGGLTPENVQQAIQLTGARQVDVSSGVESAPGVKDPAKIAGFVSAAQDILPKLR